MVEQEPKVANFLATLKQNVKIDDVKTLSAQYKPNGELLFATLQIDSPDILPYVFIRGDAVVVVVTVNDKYYLCVEQRRIADGKIHTEFPAGMMDKDNDPLEVVIKELEEETGLVIDKNAVKPMNGAIPLFTSPGACDERIYFFKTSIRMNDEDFQKFQNKFIDNGDEKITVKLYTEDELRKKLVNCITYCALHLSRS